MSGPLTWILDEPLPDDLAVPRAVRRHIREYRAALLRDPCAYCGSTSIVHDHIRPRNRGGLDTWINLVGACTSCNSSKRDRSLLGFLGKRLWASDAGERIKAIQHEVRAWDRLGRSA